MIIMKHIFSQQSVITVHVKSKQMSQFKVHTQSFHDYGRKPKNILKIQTNSTVQLQRFLHLLSLRS